MNPIPPLKTWLVAAVLVAIASGNAQARDHEPAVQPLSSAAGASVSVIDGSQGASGAPQEDLAAIADAAAARALHEVWGRPVPDPRTRQLVAVSAFLAQGNLEHLEAFARHALELGVTEEQLREVVYLTLARTGSARSEDTGDVVRQLFAARGKPLPVGL